MPVLSSFQKISDTIWEIPASHKEGMRVPARIYATEKLMRDMDEQVIDQVTNVATLPGILNYAFCMPDGHSGYGFPIGGVAAMDTDEGVISPGGIGFDVNCLSGDSRILNEHGAWRELRDFERGPGDHRLRCLRLVEREADAARIALFMKKPVDRTVYRIETEAGHTLTATADHPLWTPDGMTPVGELVEGARVAAFPLEGVPYEEPDNEILVDEADIRALVLPFNKDAMIKELRKRDLLPLRRDDPRVPYLLKLLAYNMGDGSLTVTSGKGFTWFWGRREDLEDIREDIAAVGFTPSRVYERARKHRISTTYGEVRFDFAETSVRANSRALLCLLHALGAPAGHKTEQAYEAPVWIRQGPRWHQRLFLAAYFGAEMSAPTTMKGHGATFLMPMVSLNKIEGLERAGETFLSQIADMLRGFGIRTAELSKRDEYTNAEGRKTIRVRLYVDGSSASLQKLYGTVGFEYHRQKRSLAHCAVQYLRLKEAVLEKRESVAAQAVALRDAGTPVESICEALTDKDVNARFIARSIFGGRRSRSRIPQNFPTFKGFVEERTEGLGQSGMVWDRIARIEPVPFDEPVYDFTMDHPDHNFVANGLVVSNCGMRLVVTNLTYDEVKPHLKKLVDALFERVPAGVGSTGFLKLTHSEFRTVVEEGARWCVRKGYGWEEDLGRTEEGGCIAGADASKISQKSVERGFNQIGTLGSGNHYLEIQVAKPEHVFDPETAEAFGITIPNQVVVMFHCGSRGFGHQVATDYLQTFLKVMQGKYGIQIRDRELACAPFRSPEGQDYFAAMKCAINMSFANRQVILHRIREVFSGVMGRRPEDLGMHAVYDVAHNTAKLERHVVDGREREVLVHRKGATRAFGPGAPDVPEPYRRAGQPVIIGGSMETGSYLLAGVESGAQTFFSTAHGSGRTMSRTRARKQFHGRRLQEQMAERGIYVRTTSYAGLAEEAGGAYKDIDDVIDATQQAGISRRVVRFVPVGNVKG
ncbi:MAG: hypothetical protein A3F84_13045 [Candidatus Handelsmanbacteria bacterium RIFCSPLOWO2_12_FULL_64_10]|uniref:tRNA-splicing ligase RtcB n=1 Tax=Handelsmanbacteria sp. (strain RIFCSPLOWO2_12_FULL_64_10) TaxID=1817868 RepID=A0A1F6C463_HANXR|nr:MAG: hypothetical protein A3F84_13045 [Candidatus Handelsmanbacteria bacterium RIFCSPLOWO2_12_FULL_64_10]